MTRATHRKTFRHSHDGFTFIELLIVVMMLGTMAAVAIPAFMKNAKKAKTTEAAIARSAFHQAEIAYFGNGHSTFGSAPELL